MSGLRAHRVITALLLTAAAATLMVGCNDDDLSPVEEALAEYRDLPPAEREAALRELAADPELEAIAHYGLGNHFGELAATEDAEPGPESVTGLNALLDSAVVHYRAAIAVDSTMVEAWVNMGLVFDDLSDGRTPQAREALGHAREAYAKAIELSPGDEKARCNLGALFFRRHQYPEAMEQFRAVLDTNPESALAHYNLAIMFAESRMYREARVEWELAAKYDPDGDIGDRSRDNIKVVDDLMNSEIPPELEDPKGH